VDAAVRAVIVNYETRDELRRALRSLMEEATPGLDIVVVDNASGDGSAAMVRREFPRVRLMASPVNLGFAGGVNLGLDGNTADYALILNPDVGLSTRTIERMVTFMEAHPAAAAVSPLLVGRDGAIHEHLYRRFPTVPQIALFWTALGRISRRVGWARYRWMEHRVDGSGPTVVDQCPGAAILIRGTDLSEIGPWDAGYFIWWEDVDWCYRARLAGRELFVLSDLRALHGGGASFRSWGTERQMVQFHRAFFRFLVKHRLHRLLIWSRRILGADLRLKQAIASLWLRLRSSVPEPYRPETFATVREQIERMARHRESGRLPDLVPDVPHREPGRSE
jgi:N-acetylglucosaminyl-diphospho-decaprenol L-rhamnosyltransferase